MEKDIERKVCDYAAKQNILSRKYRTPGRRNTPDRIFFTRKGLVFLVEFKDTGEKPRKGQIREAGVYSDFNIAVYFVDNVVAGRALIDAYT
ncbi:MAG: hypothetical protein KAT00_00145 [Planctomycetes bacterium]|nr:hypothetical protein [Planctomycetota bacterium]